MNIAIIQTAHFTTSYPCCQHQGDNALVTKAFFVDARHIGKDFLALVNVQCGAAIRIIQEFYAFEVVKKIFTQTFASQKFHKQSKCRDIKPCSGRRQSFQKIIAVRNARLTVDSRNLVIACPDHEVFQTAAVSLKSVFFHVNEISPLVNKTFN